MRDGRDGRLFVDDEFTAPVYALGAGWRGPSDRFRRICILEIVLTDHGHPPRCAADLDCNRFSSVQASDEHPRSRRRPSGSLDLPRPGPLRKNNFTRRSWWPLRERVGLEGVRFLDLRHTAATLLLSAGVHPKVVQERLGHSTVALTLDVYSHVLGSLQREAADKLDEVLQ